MFDPLAEDYDAARPSYPNELYDAVARLAGVAWTGLRVADVGAGTGIATRAMAARGARVVAVDLGAGMLRRLRDHSDAAPAAIARAHALPLADDSVDLVTFAQAWHWMDVDAATAEVARACRPGGALAVWRNDVDARGERWWEDQQDRIEAANPRYERGYRDEDYVGPLLATGRFASVETWAGHWERRVDLDTYERWLRSKSYVVAIGDGLEDFIAAERASLGRAFPGGVVREPFRMRAHVARIA